MPVANSRPVKNKNNASSPLSWSSVLVVPVKLEVSSQMANSLGRRSNVGIQFVLLVTLMLTMKSVRVVFAVPMWILIVTEKNIIYIWLQKRHQCGFTNFIPVFTEKMSFQRRVIYIFRSLFLKLSWLKINYILFTTLICWGRAMIDRIRSTHINKVAKYPMWWPHGVVDITPE